MKVGFRGILGTEASDVLTTAEMPAVPRVDEQVEMSDGLVVTVKSVYWTPFSNFDYDAIARVQ